MHYAFDLDGTLVDTKELVRKAYIHAGVVPPDDFFGKTFFEWFTGDPQEAQEVHSNKQQYYMEHIKSVKPLPLMELLKALVLAGRAPTILTGASATSYQLLSSVFPILVDVQAETSLNLAGKIRYMNETAPIGIMFEDNLKAIEPLKKGTGWTICCTY